MTRTDFDSTTGAPDLRQVFNQAVDAELGPRRPATAFVPSPVPVENAGSWRRHLLAASVLAVAVGGTVLAIQHARTPGPALVAPGSVVLHTSPAPPAGHHRGPYPPFTAPEAATVPGVSIGPVSAHDARYQPASIQVLPQPGRAPTPGIAFPLRIKLVSTASNAPQVVSMTGIDLASAVCPRSFLSRPGHTYIITCPVAQRPNVHGQLRISLTAADGGVSSGTFTLSG